MLLCSNNTFRCLGITVLAACPLITKPFSLYAANSQAKKVLVLHSSYHDLLRIYFSNKKHPKKIISDYVETVDLACSKERIQDRIIECIYKKYKSMRAKFSISNFNVSLTLTYL